MENPSTACRTFHTWIYVPRSLRSAVVTTPPRLKAGFRLETDAKTQFSILSVYLVLCANWNPAAEAVNLVYNWRGAVGGEASSLKNGKKMMQMTGGIFT
jgi:hypothetical protein